ncbi:MAG: hypothetical protein ABJF11_08040 [Reichenbachiella sp.]|uniref:hypothetical protein n=1 Tax=Reichenbachiella sp. TaxID=2184521 RepID=UPI0032657E64
MSSHKLKLLSVLLCYIVLMSSCGSEGDSQTNEIPFTSKQVTTLANETLNGISPIFEEVKNSARVQSEPLLLSFDLVFDTETNQMAILGFKEESYFPIDGREETARALGTVYTVDCTIGNKTTSIECDGKWNCGSAIADCLEQGGCATICENPSGLSAQSIRNHDIRFLADRGISSTTISASLLKTTSLDLSKTSVYSVKLKRFLYF